MLVLLTVFLCVPRFYAATATSIESSVELWEECARYVNVKYVPGTS